MRENNLKRYALKIKPHSNALNIKFKLVQMIIFSLVILITLNVVPLFAFAGIIT
jgi:hypothetical protein